MKHKYYRIQIIPEDSQKIKSLRINTKWFTIAKIALVIFICVSSIFIFNLAKINRILVDYEKMKISNAQILKRDKSYEDILSRLDTLWVLEERIQTIFGTYLENDSNKINSLIDKNKFAHVSSQKNHIEFDGTQGWETMEQKMNKGRIPSVLPVIGVQTKKFQKNDSHPGVEFSTAPGNPIFASGNGTVEFIGEKDGLGKTVIINHKNGYKSAYSNLADIRIQKGNTVQKGTIIGSTVKKDNSKNAILYYEITKDDIPQDPETFFNY